MGVSGEPISRVVEKEPLILHLEEYRSLRSEADMHYKLLYDFVNYSVIVLAGTIAALGLVTQTENLWVILVLPVPLALFALMSIGEAMKVGQLSYYVKEVLRPRVSDITGVESSEFWEFEWYQTYIRKDHRLYDASSMLFRSFAHNSLFLGTILGAIFLYVDRRPTVSWGLGELVLLGIDAGFLLLVAFGSVVSARPWRTQELLAIFFGWKDKDLG